MNKTFIVHFSREKILLFSLGSLTFVWAGVYFLFSRAVFLIILGTISILFFGSIAIILTFKLFNQKPAIKLDKTGITDNSSGVSFGFIPWNEIRNISLEYTGSNPFIYITTARDDYYIKRQKGIFRRFIMRVNKKYFGSGLTISLNTLNKPKEEICIQVHKYWSLYKEDIP